jgi:hypothetical protein
MSGDRVSVARCSFCGKEFDDRRFQVLVPGSRGTYDTAECALLDAAGEPRPRVRIRERPDVPLKQR